jgi:hypothetical protein
MVADSVRQTQPDSIQYSETLVCPHAGPISFGRFVLLLEGTEQDHAGVDAEDGQQGGDVTDASDLGDQ